MMRSGEIKADESKSKHGGERSSRAGDSGFFASR